MRSATYWLIAFLIWMAAGLIYLNVGDDLRETPEKVYFEDGFYITTDK